MKYITFNSLNNKIYNFLLFLIFIFLFVFMDLRADSRNLDKKTSLGNSLKEYFIDPTHSSVSFAIKHLSVADTIGVFEDFSGEVFYDDVGKILKLKGKVDVNSVNTFNVGRDNDIKNTDFFKNHNITLESTTYKDNILGAKITINGITKNIKLRTQILGPIRNPSLDIKDSKNHTKGQMSGSQDSNLKSGEANGLGLDKKDQDSKKSESKNPLLTQNINNTPLVNQYFTKSISTDSNDENKEDCGCYVSYGDNVLGIVMEGRVNRFDFNISPLTPKELLGQYVDFKIILEVSN